MYCNKNLDLWNTIAGHKGANNVWVKGSDAFVKDINVDMQPYSSELLKKTYGYEEECTKRLFTDVDEDIKMGSVLKDTSEEINYVVNRIIPWDDHMELMCKEIMSNNG